MGSQSDKFATPRIAAGALFVDGRRVFLVRKTCGHHWDIPGGYVDGGESPAAACERELREELGLDVVARRLLVNDWAPNGSEGDKILYIFDCGILKDSENSVKLDHVEVDAAEWVDISELNRFLIPRLNRRVSQAYRAHVGGIFLYLEHGEPVSDLS